MDDLLLLGLGPRLPQALTQLKRGGECHGALAPRSVALICLALAIAVLAASARGRVHSLRALPALLWGEPAPDQVLWRNVLIDIRLPRVLFAVVAGRAWPCPAPPCRRCSAIRWPSRA